MFILQVLKNVSHYVHKQCPIYCTEGCLTHKLRPELQTKNKELKGLTNYYNILQMKATVKHNRRKTESLLY